MEREKGVAEQKENKRKVIKKTSNLLDIEMWSLFVAHRKKVDLKFIRDGVANKHSKSPWRKSLQKPDVKSDANQEVCNEST